MEPWGLVASVTAAKLISISGVAATIGGALVGLLFKNAATAWREERDAAVDKADRLEEKVSEQASQILTLERKVEVLEKRTDYDAFADRSGREHAQIIAALGEVTRGLNANTTAVEFLLKQVFPTAVLPTGSLAPPA